MPSSVSSDSATSLIIRLQQNDGVAWEELVEMYGPLIFHWCRKFQLSSADSADITQDVFASVAKSISTYQKSPAGTLRGWMWTITQNKLRDLVRKRPRQFDATGGTEALHRLHQMEDLNGSQSHEEFTSNLESKHFLHRALNLIQTDFQPQTWQAFWRSTIDGLDTATIAEQLEMSTNSVRQAKSRVLRRLREQLGDQ